MTNTIWVYIDHYRGEAYPGSWEAITAGKILARSLGGGIKALVLGDQVADLANQAIQFGADEVLVVENPALADFRADPYATVVSQQAKAGSPAVILVPDHLPG